MSDRDKVKVRIETSFLAIPDAIAREPDLSSSAKVLFGCIYSLSHTESGCYGSNYSLAKRVGLSLRQLQRVFKELEKWKLIKRHVEGDASERPEIEVLWKGKILKPRKAPDKLSRGRKGSDKLSTPHDKLSVGTPHDKLSVAPPMTSCHTFQDKKRKPSGPDGPEKVFHKIAGSTPTDPGGPSSNQTQEESGSLIPWRRLVHGNESVEDVCLAATTAGYTVGLREEGKLIDLAPTDGRKPTYRDREAMTEFGKRIRLAQKTAEANGTAIAVEGGSQ